MSQSRAVKTRAGAGGSQLWGSRPTNSTAAEQRSAVQCCIFLGVTANELLGFQVKEERNAFPALATVFLIRSHCADIRIAVVIAGNFLFALPKLIFNYQECYINFLSCSEASPLSLRCSVVWLSVSTCYGEGSAQECDTAYRLRADSLCDTPRSHSD